MCLSRYLDEISTELSALVGFENGSRWILEQINQLEKRINGCRPKLHRLRLALDQLDQRIAEKKQCIERLTNRIEVYLNVKDHANAWQYAMSLDRLNKLLEQELAQATQLRKAFQRLAAHKKHLQEKLANFLAGFYPNNN